MDCRVVVEAAVPVYDVETADEAVRIAISKTGEMLNPDLNYVEINMGTRTCPDCGAEHDPAFIAADESLVALELEMTVFNVEREEHASRIARKEIGQRLENIPLDVLEIEVLEDDDDEDDDGEDEAEADSSADSDESAGDSDANTDEADEEEVETADGDEDSPSASGDGGTAVDRAAEEIGEDGDNAGSADRNRDALEDEVLPEFDELIEE